MHLSRQSLAVVLAAKLKMSTKIHQKTKNPKQTGHGQQKMRKKHTKYLTATLVY